MKLRSLALAAGLTLLALPASAQQIDITASEDFQTKITEDYGDREAEYLRSSLNKAVEDAFAQKGVSPDHVVLTIEDAKPTHPTLKQASDKPGLDMFRSVSLGGAKVTGVAYDANDAEIGRLEYKWYESDLRYSFGKSTWYDTKRAFRLFATRFADTVAEAQPASAS